MSPFSQLICMSAKITPLKLSTYVSRMCVCIFVGNYGHVKVNAFWQFFSLKNRQIRHMVVWSLYCVTLHRATTCHRKYHSSLIQIHMMTTSKNQAL